MYVKIKRANMSKSTDIYTITGIRREREDYEVDETTVFGATQFFYGGSVILELRLDNASHDKLLRDIVLENKTANIDEDDNGLFAVTSA